MKILNLKNYGVKKASFFLALEEYLLEESNDDIFFLWDLEEAIVIGKNQLLDSEVNMSFVRQNNIKIYRRPSGGGAIYSDQGNFMFSFITRKENKDEIYHEYLKKIIDILASLNIKAYFSGRNDLMLDSKKFSGTAFYKNKKGCVLHGTFLFDTDLDKLTLSLTAQNDKLISKGIKSFKERVVNIKDYTNLSKTEFMAYLINNISEDVYEKELDLNKISIIQKKYEAKEYIYSNKIPYEIHNNKRYPFGRVEVFLNIKKGIITTFKINGDFFEKQDIKLFEEKIQGVPYEYTFVCDFLNKVNINCFIEGMENIELIDLIFYKRKETQ